MAEPTFISKFYLIVNPGLEDLALEELRANLPDLKNLRKDIGGIEFEAEILEGLELNARLKICSRILMRVDDFAASDFPKLFKKMLKISWKHLVSEDTPLRMEVSSETSRLAIKKRIADTAEEAVQKYFRTQKKEKKVKTDTPPPVPPEQRIYLRFVDDICTLSIDTSGEHLHKRGYRKLIGEAPLRENLASALLNALFAKIAKTGDPTAANSASFELVDPMMGSGTFLLEAYHYFMNSDLRGYAFENWPYIKNLNKSESAGDKQPDAVNQDANFQTPSVRQILKIKSLIGFDQDKEASEITLENLKSLKGTTATQVARASQTTQTPDPSSKPQAAPKFEASQKNLFEMKSLAVSAGLTRVVISNPPYGKRIKVQGKIADFYSDLFARCEANLKPLLAGFLISDDVPEKQIKVPKSWKMIEQIRFRNGGIKVRFVIFKA